MILIATTLFVLFPWLVIGLCRRFNWLDSLGTVVLSFATGIALAAIFDLQTVFPAIDISSLQTRITEIAIALAIPLLVFSINVRSALMLAGPTLKSMAVALATVVTTSTVLAFLFRFHIEDIWQVAGMSVGAYTGGGPNMAAIKSAINGDQALFITMTTYDILLSAIYLVFVMTLAKPVFKHFLPGFSHDKVDKSGALAAFEHLSDESAHAFKMLLDKNKLAGTCQSLMAALIVVILGVGLASTLPESMQSVATIILITSLGVAASFIGFVQRLKNSFQLGMYLILVFCFTMGSLTDLDLLRQLQPALFAYIGLILFGSLLIHALICKLLKIDVDTFIITASAAIMSVPFIPVIAGALKNRAILLPGFAAAILGYVLGNYLGIATAYFVRWATSS